MNPKIRIERIYPVKGRGNLRAFVDFWIGDSLFRSWRIIQEEGKAPWVSPPVESWEDGEGKRRYKRLIVFSDSLQEQVAAAILGAWEEWEQQEESAAAIPF